MTAISSVFGTIVAGAAPKGNAPQRARATRPGSVARRSRYSIPALSWVCGRRGPPPTTKVNAHQRTRTQLVGGSMVGIEFYIHPEWCRLWCWQTLKLYSAKKCREGSGLIVQIHGCAPGLMTTPTIGINTFLHRYELIEGSLVRRKISEGRPHTESVVYVIDVLLNEDETGRYLNGVRGYIIPERDQSQDDPVADLYRARTFDVSLDLLLAIGRDLGVGPHPRQPPRLVTLNGRRVD